MCARVCVRIREGLRKCDEQKQRVHRERALQRGEFVLRTASAVCDRVDDA